MRNDTYHVKQHAEERFGAMAVQGVHQNHVEPVVSHLLRKPGLMCKVYILYII